MKREEATAIGLRSLRTSAVTAVAVGVALISGPLYTWRHWIAGVFAGLLYANVFEYLFHRFLLHSANDLFAPLHARHHQTWGEDSEGLHVTFGDSPDSVVLLLCLNAIPFMLLEWLAGPGLGAGVVLGLVAYWIAMEQIHWRCHMGDLPKFLEPCRRHHSKHHEGRGSYNLFLPLCDWLVSSFQGAVACFCLRNGKISWRR